MEEDITNLKEVIKNAKEFNLYKGNRYFKSMENLIARNKELEEYKKIAELTKISCCTAQNCEALNNSIKDCLENIKLRERVKELEEEIENINKQLDLDYVDNNYIQVSKVKEKIEELKQEYKIALEKNPIKAFILKCQIQVLQELLEK